MYWSKLFIPTLRESPAEAQSDAHRLLIRAGYLRGRNYLPLGMRVAQRMAAIARAEMEAIGGQEISAGNAIAEIAAELRSHRQLPQIWFQIPDRRVQAWSFDPGGECFRPLEDAARRILERTGASDRRAPLEPVSDLEGDFPPEEFHTPDQKSIADISRFTGLPPTVQMKSLVVVADREPVLALVRGDHQLEEEKLAWYLGARELRPATAEEIRDAFGADAGSLGPIGVRIRTVLDDALRGRRNLICGANRNDYHLKNVTPGRDFEAEFHEIRERGGAQIARTRSRVSTLQVTNESSKTVSLVESAAELFLDRALESAADGFRDADGLALPVAIAPFTAIITPVNMGDAAQRAAAHELHDTAPFDALLDDRDERAGVKFKDADLIGVPFRITLGKKLADGVVEIRNRIARTSEDVALGDALAFVRKQTE